MSNNPPDRIVELTEAQHRFLMRNCDSNIAFGLAQLQADGASREFLVNIVELVEQFKSVKKALERAK